MKINFKNKWSLSWLCLILIFAGYSVFLLNNYDQPWFNAIMQIGYILISLVAMVLIMLHTFNEANKGAEKQITVFKDESLKQVKTISESTVAQIENIKQNTNEQIIAIQKASQEQTNTIQASTEKQISNLNDVTSSQIKVYQEESEKQINNLQHSTEKQINSFVQQTNDIVERLEKLSESITNLTELNKEMLENEKELRELEEEKYRKREEELRVNYLDKLERVERLRPDLHFRTEVDSHLIIFNYIYFYLYNSGGDASSITINISLKKSSTNEGTSITSKTFHNVARLKQYSFKWLRAKHYKDYDQIVIETSSRDLQHREYHGHWIFERNDNVWIKIETVERSLINKGGNNKYLSL